MALQTVTDDGYLTWRCELYEFGELVSCGELKTAHIDEMVYLTQDPSEARGATIALPQCSCGVQSFIKADYTVKELAKALKLVADEQTNERAYVLPLRYMLNLRVHWMLYERGKAAYAPVLEMPPQALLEHPSFAGVKPSTVYALWFGYSTIRQVAPQAVATIQNMFIEGPKE